MKKILKTMLLLAAISSGTGMFVSCSDDDNLTTADALFRPVINEDDNIELGLDDNNVPYMIVTWDNYTDANEYTVKVETVDGTGTQEITTSELTCRFDNLEYDKEYFVYISAANTQTGLKSKAFSLTTTTPDFPTHLITPTSTDIIDIAARISWSDDDYDELRILLNSDDTVVDDIELTAEDREAQTYIITGLEPKTTYKVEAYKNGVYQGKKRITTAAAESFSGNVVDLRGVEDTQGWISTANITELVEQYPDQDITVVLEGGSHYKYQSVNFPATTGTIKFITGLSLAGNAVFDCSGEHNVANDITVGGITYEKIFFADVDGNKTSSNYGGHYLFNVNSSGHIGNLTFKSCQIKYKRGCVRTRSTFVVDQLTYDDCILDSIGGYAIAMAEGTSCITNIKMVNSTVANCNRTFVNTVSTAGSIDISNSTFVYCTASSRNFDDINNCKEFKISNCLFGITGETPVNVVSESSTTTGFRGWAAACNPVPATSDCFFTSDVAWRLGADGAPAAQFQGTTISTDTKGTFKDPEHSDFTILNTSELKGIGDPRWY